jgi:hypothetical protein
MVSIFLSELTYLEVTSPWVPETLQRREEPCCVPFERLVNHTHCDPRLPNKKCKPRPLGPPLSEDAVALVAFLSNPASDAAGAMLIPFLPSMYVVDISAQRGNAAKTPCLCLFWPSNAEKSMVQTRRCLSEDKWGRERTESKLMMSCPRGALRRALRKWRDEGGRGR